MNDRLPQFVSAGDLLTDLLTTGPATWQSRPGGAGWNVARTVARLGVPSACAAALGEDAFSDEQWQASAAAGLDLRFLQRYPRPPLLAIVHRIEPPAYFFIGDGAADLSFDPRALPEGWTDAVRWVHFGCLSLHRQPLGETLLALAGDLSERGIKISYDPNYRLPMAHGYRPTLERMSALADLIKVSDDDLCALFATNDAAAALDELRALNPAATIFVTRGRSAASLWHGKDSCTALPPHIDVAEGAGVADSVGAGDAAIGGLLFSLMREPQRDWPAHLAFALAAGAAACRVSGAYAPSLGEVDALARSHAL
jgi:fructokinase